MTCTFTSHPRLSVSYLLSPLSFTLLQLYFSSGASPKPPSSSFCSSESKSTSSRLISFIRASYAVKSSSSAGVGRVSEVSQRPSAPQCRGILRTSARTAVLTHQARAQFQADQVLEDLLAGAAVDAAARHDFGQLRCLGRLRVASSVTTDTQPSMRASRPSRRCTASSWSSVRWGLNMPPSECFLYGVGVAHVHLGCGVLHAVHVHADAAGVARYELDQVFSRSQGLPCAGGSARIHARQGRAGPPAGGTSMLSASCW